jgi:hypothetical protein
MPPVGKFSPTQGCTHAREKSKVSSSVVWTDGRTTAASTDNATESTGCRKRDMCVWIDPRGASCHRREN